MQKKQRKITHFFHGLGIAIEHLSPVATKSGSFGCIAIFKHPELGMVFVLNGEIQHVEAWAPLYHEPLVHLPAAFVSKVKDVLILGGGTLYAAAEALKYKSVERVVLIDHDPQVPKTAAKYYDHAKACFDDKRFNVIFDDAYSSINNFQDQFDLIINDGADLISARPKSRSASLRSDQFSKMTRALKSTGVCADVIYRHIFERQRTVFTIRHLQRSVRLALSLVFLPEYHGVLHVLAVWGKKSSNVTQVLRRPLNREQQRWVKTSTMSPCTYYDPRFLQYYLYLPRYLNDALGTIKTTA